MTLLREIEKAIRERQFDAAFHGVAALGASAARAMEAGDPDAHVKLRELLINISRLLLLARAERAHMASELRAISGAVSYQPGSSSASTWQIEA